MTDELCITDFSVYLRPLYDIITLCALIDSSFLFNTMNFGWFVVYIEVSQVIIFLTK